MESIEEIFRKRRIALGLSQAEVAAAAMLSVRALTYFETGRAGISLSNLRRLLTVVGLDVSAREASPRPTLDELPGRYDDEDAPEVPKRLAKKARRARRSGPRAHARPATLAEAAARGLAQNRRDAMLREFCDEFYKADSRDRGAMIAAEPAIQGGEADAYYAAVAEHLALQSGLHVPRWALRKERFLRKPFFPAGLESLKSTTLVESPVAFRRRMIFVGANPLARPARSL
jgi:transcriptional regulator with XRE-family HTH domain